MKDDMSSVNEILCLCDDSVECTSVENESDTKLIAHVQKKVAEEYCELCGSKMISKGPRIRTVHHPIFQDGRDLDLKVTTRKWYCRLCNRYVYDSFKFIDKSKQISNLTDYMILAKMKDLSATATHIANELGVSDTYVHETFMRYVDLPRLPLCPVLCIDEVYLNFDNSNLYALVLMNWETGEIIDILKNRHKDTIYEYLSNIPREERDVVKYVVSDMYDTYSSLAGKDSFFRNAVSIIDCFHHTQPIITMIMNYIHQVKKRYQERDRKKLDEENYRNNRNYKSRKDSREVHLLKRYDYFLLKNHDDIDYTPRYRELKGRAGFWFYPAHIEKEFMELDKNFYEIRELKEKYIHFTHSHMNDPEGAAEELNELIALYRSSHLAMFRLFAETLDSHKAGIIASFTFMKADRITANDEVLRRISSGPMESYNNKPKDLKRQSNGVSNYWYTRNRLLWSSRKDPAIKAIPYSRDEVHTNGKKRGSYKKKKKK